MTQQDNDLCQPIGFPVLDWSPCVRPPRTDMIGRYCRVVPLALDEAPALFRAFNEDAEGRIWTYLPYGPISTERALVTWIKETCLGEDALFYTVLDAKTGRALGVASYLRIAPAVGSIEVGHVIFSPALQRRRAATECMYLMMKQAFDLGYRRYEWKCDNLNMPSKKAAARLGMTFEGVFRQATVYKGRSRDTAWFSILDTEWSNARAGFEAWLSSENFDTEGKQLHSLAKCRG